MISFLTAGLALGFDFLGFLTPASVTDEFFDDFDAEGLDVSLRKDWVRPVDVALGAIMQSSQATVGNSVDRFEFLGRIDKACEMMG